jgi:hypothetical protein
MRRRESRLQREPSEREQQLSERERRERGAKAMDELFRDIILS